MFQGTDSKKFHRYFQTEFDCLQYLYKIKWERGFCCRRCGHKSCFKGRTQFHARCKHCDYDESVIANTAFQRIKFPLLKAFSLVFYLTVLKKGAASRNVAGLIGVDQKTILSFGNKLRNVMGAYVLASMKKPVPVQNCSLDSIL